eukprot:12120953-Alexandrium_andersonii.AAC.1
MGDARAYLWSVHDRPTPRGVTRVRRRAGPSRRGQPQTQRRPSARGAVEGTTTCNRRGQPRLSAGTRMQKPATGAGAVRRRT